MDYATKYLEAVPLTSIYAVTVAEALLDMYSRVEVLDKYGLDVRDRSSRELSNLGTQFTSDCMMEMSRLLFI